MSNVIELRRQRAAVLDQADGILTAALGEQRALSDEEQGQVDGLKRQADKLAEQATLAEEIEAARSTKAVAAPAVNRGARGDNEANAWKAFARHGDVGGLRHLLQDGEESRGKADIVVKLPSQRQTRSMIEQRVTDSTMNITTSGDGANLVPTGLVPQIAARKNELMLAERLGCRRIPGQGTTVNYPYENKDPDPFAATSEQSDAHGNNYERNAMATALRAFMLAKLLEVELTEEMFEDTPVDFMSHISDVIGREIAVTHNALLVANVEALGTSLKTFASNSAIAAGELEAVIGNDALGFYVDDASDVHWLMRSTTHWAINSVVGDARFYAQQLDGLLGHDVVHSTKVDAIGASGKSVMFGDWNYMGYREAPELRFIQDPYSVDGIVVLKYSFRACYGLLQAGALGYGVHP